MNLVNDAEKKEKKEKTELINIEEKDYEVEDYYKCFDYENENLNKLNDEELKKHKDNMEKEYTKNVIQPGHRDFEYDIEVNKYSLI